MGRSRKDDHHSRLSFRRDRAEQGIALLVVMILFVVLYLVVYHLHFYTMMEEKVARVRQGDIQSQDALYSVGQLVIAQLVEDLAQDHSEGSEESAGAATGGERAAAGGSLAAAMGDSGRAGAGRGDDDAQFTPIPAARGGGGAGAAGGSAGTVDYLLEALFNPQTQSIGNVEVKVVITDNERRFDLNRLFQYARVPGEEEAITGPGGTVTGDDLAGMAEEAGTGEGSTEKLTTRIRERVGILDGARDRARPNDRSDDNDDPDDPDGGTVSAEAGAALGLDEEAELNQFTEPSGERVEATTEMVARAIEVVLSLNEDRGFGYQATYNSENIAREVVQYVLTRRQLEVQNRIYDVAELFNLGNGLITKELFYGPVPQDLPEEGLVFDSGFVLSRDDFGDLVASYSYDDVYVDERANEVEELGRLKEEFGSFMNFPGLSGLNANALTRGMTSPVTVYDEDLDIEYVEEPPIPLGLRDIFTTFSNGKININTASVPVLYALLPLLTDGADGEANQVATAISQYRLAYQEYEDEGDGIDTDVASTLNLGQPRRALPMEGEDGYYEGDAANDMLYDYDAVGSAGQSGYGAYDAGVGMEDLETNYFTSLQQVELVDGTDGGPDDQLSSQNSGVDRVDDEDDSLLQRVLNDYQQVMVFGSTYFTVELKAKVEGSPLVKSGYLTVKRDPAKKMMEVVFWKELQK